MNQKLMFYLLDIAAYPLFVAVGMWLSGYVDFGGSDAAGQGMASGFGALLYGLIAAVFCVIVSFMVSSKLLGSCWPAVHVLLLQSAVLLIWCLCVE